MERRHHSRIRHGLPVSLLLRGELLGTFITRDLSLGGLSIDTPRRQLGEGEVVSVHFHVEQEIPPASGRVVHRGHGTIGIALTEHSRPTADVVRNAMLRKARGHIFPAGQVDRPPEDPEAGSEDRTQSLLLTVGGNLDLTCVREFQYAIGMIRRRAVERVVIDLAKTRRVFDSGVGLLLLLLDTATELEKQIRLINCTPALREYFDTLGLNWSTSGA